MAYGFFEFGPSPSRVQLYKTDCKESLNRTIEEAYKSP